MRASSTSAHGPSSTLTHQLARCCLRIFLNSVFTGSKSQSELTKTGVAELKASSERDSLHLGAESFSFLKITWKVRFCNDDASLRGVVYRRRRDTFAPCLSQWCHCFMGWIIIQVHGDAGSCPLWEGGSKESSESACRAADAARPPEGAQQDTNTDTWPSHSEIPSTSCLQCEACSVLPTGAAERLTQESTLEVWKQTFVQVYEKGSKIPRHEWAPWFWLCEN